MKKVLIADSGSTKTEWALLDGDDKTTIITQGISPYFLNTPQIESLLREELLPKMSRTADISQVYYYGTGCTSTVTVSIVSDALENLFPGAAIHVTYDLVAAAHALCGNEQGIVCILGTGSNSCYWDGEKIAKNNPGLGYMLGDEGSGAFLGKLIIAEYLYSKLDADLADEFEKKFETDKDALLAKVYAAPLPNRFLASFSPFFAEHRGNKSIEKLLKMGLDDFFTKHIMSYGESSHTPVHFTGSIAWIYQDVLLELCTAYSLQPGDIVKEPMKKLVEYYMARPGGL